LHSGILVVNTD